MLLSQMSLSNPQGALKQRLGVGVPALQQKYLAQVVQGGRHGRMVRSEGLLFDGDRSPVQALGLGVVLLFEV